jgi:hypothetical protein
MNVRQNPTLSQIVKGNTWTKAFTENSTLSERFLHILIENLISLINSSQQLNKHMEKKAFEFYLQMAKTNKETINK